MDRDGFSVESQRRKGQPVPEWYEKEPWLYPGDQEFLTAFWRLNSERPVGMSRGPIPWSAIVAYATWVGLDYQNTVFFVDLMEALDTVYLEWHGENKPGKKPDPVKQTGGKWGRG